MNSTPPAGRAPLNYPPTPACDFGFGTAYERVALYGFLRRHIDALPGDPPRTGLEGFHDGFTGLPGLHLLPQAARGMHVTVACVSEAMQQSVRNLYDRFDLASRLSTPLLAHPSALPPGETCDVLVLFNPFPYRDDWEDFLHHALARVRRLAFVSVANRVSYGALVRRAMKACKPSPRYELFDHPSTRPAAMRDFLRARGFSFREDFVDCPWWPDLFVDAGQSIASWIASQFGITPRPAGGRPPAASFSYGRGLYPYLDPGDAEYQGLLAKISRHPTFDSLPPSRPKALFGHHRIFTITPR